MNHYEVLGIPPDADDYMILRSYSYLISRLHSGLGTRMNDRPLPTEEQLNQARLTLTNADARAAYDRQLAGDPVPGDEEVLAEVLAEKEIEIPELPKATLYDALGIHPGADERLIRRAYESQRAQLSSGRLPTVPRPDYVPTEEEIEEAYWTLAHGFRRAIYDVQTFGGQRTQGWAKTNDAALFGGADPLVRGMTRMVQALILIVFASWAGFFFVRWMLQNLSLGLTVSILSVILVTVLAFAIWRLRDLFFTRSRGKEYDADWSASRSLIGMGFAIALGMSLIGWALVWLIPRFFDPGESPIVWALVPVGLVVGFFAIFYFAGKGADDPGRVDGPAKPPSQP